MTYRVILTAKAKRQLRAAYQWWAENRSQQQAAKWYNGFLATLDSLSTNPDRCQLARENPDLPIELRQLVYGTGKRKTHRALFTIKQDKVVVYAVRHLAQQDISPEDLHE